MAVRKDESRGRWLAEFYQNGKRFRKWFLTKSEAQAYFNQQKSMALVESESLACDDLAPLSFYAKQWFELYGQTLNDGQARLNKLLNLCQHLGDPPANKFSTSLFAESPQPPQISCEFRFGFLGVKN